MITNRYYLKTTNVFALQHLFFSLHPKSSFISLIICTLKNAFIIFAVNGLKMNAWVFKNFLMMDNINTSVFNTDQCLKCQKEKQNNPLNMYKYLNIENLHQ